MRKTAIFILIVIIALIIIPRVTSTAYGQVNDYDSNQNVQITAADPSEAPSAVFYGKAIGSITAGDLFYVDAANSQADITLSLYVTNTDELTHYLRYITLRVAVYIQDGDGQWTIPQSGVEEPPETYLTLQNSPASFTLTGGVRYKISIISGCYYCISTGNPGDRIIPRFYLNSSRK
jgi:hypothetical protein